MTRKAQDRIGIALLFLVGGFIAFVAGANLAILLR